LNRLNILQHSDNESSGYEIAGANLTVGRLQRHHQMIFATLELEKPPAFEDSKIEELRFEQKMLISAYCFDNATIPANQVGSKIDWNSHKALINDIEHTRIITCKRSKDLCEPTLVFFQHFIMHDSIHLEVKLVHEGRLFDTKLNPADSFGGSFTIVFVNGDFTQFEHYFKYVFVALSGVVLVQYFRSLPAANLSLSTWTWQQRWIFMLLVLLFLFNDPLFRVSVYGSPASSEGVTGFYVVSMAAFVSTLLCFWLAMFTVVGRPERLSHTTSTTGSGGVGAKIKRSMTENETFAPHCILCTIIFVCGCVLHFYERMHSDRDPSFSTSEDIAKANYHSLWIFGTALISIYSIWLLLLVGQCCKQICNMAPAFVFLFGITTASIAVVLVGMYLHAMSPLPSASTSFLGFYVICNLYVWTMALAYTPSDADDNNINNYDNEPQSQSQEQHTELAVVGRAHFGGGGGGGVRSGHVNC